MGSETVLQCRRHGPASGGPAKQLVVLLHGLGADGADLIALAPMLAESFPDAVFVAPDAPHPCDMAPFGRQWFSLQQMTMDHLLEGARASEPTLNAFIDRELGAHGLADAALAVVGFSQGTMMALHCCLRRPASPAALVGFSGFLIAPERLAADITVRPPVLLVHGTEDEVIPFEAMAVARDGLRAAGLEVEAVARPGLGHGIDPEGITLCGRHLERAFGAGVNVEDS